MIADRDGRAGNAIDTEDQRRARMIDGYSLIGGNDAFVVSDLTADPRFGDMAPVRGDDGARFYAGMPLVMRDGTLAHLEHVIALRDGCRRAS